VFHPAEPAAALPYIPANRRLKAQSTRVQRRMGILRPWSAAALVALIAAATLSSSCGVVRKKPDEEAKKHAEQAQQLQLRVMRYADEYAGRILGPLRGFKGETTDAEARLATQNWTVQQVSTAYIIATGPNSVTNALDMVVLTHMSRTAVEDGWVEERFGIRIHTLRDVYRSLEPQAWALLEGVISEQQVADLHTALETWSTQNPHQRSVSYVHFRDFATSQQSLTPSRGFGGSSLLSLVGLDPLSSLDPTMREVALTRQSAERAIYYLERSPQLLDMQVERLTYQLAVMPEARSMLADADRASRAAASMGKLAETLPEVVAKEREAAISQFMGELQSQQAQMRELLVDMRATLQAGTAASDSVNQTTRTLDAFIAGFRKPPNPNAPPGKPFDITEYATTAHELAAAAAQLQGLLAQLNASGPGASKLTESAATQLSGVVDRAYRRIAELILLLVFATLIAVVLYRLVMRRIIVRQPT
jgi:hypothetical protein